MIFVSRFRPFWEREMFRVSGLSQGQLLVDCLGFLLPLPTSFPGSAIILCPEATRLLHPDHCIHRRLLDTCDRHRLAIQARERHISRLLVLRISVMWGIDKDTDDEKKRLRVLYHMKHFK